MNDSALSMASAGPLPPQIVRSPEGLLLPFRTATAGERMAAFAIDVLVVILLLLAVVLPGLLFAFMGATVMPTLMMLWFFLLRFGWFSWAEIRGGGRTPGKRRYHLRVIRSDGGPLTAEILLARNLTRDIETFLPTMLVLNPDMLFAGHDGLVRILSMVWVIVLLLVPLTNSARLRVGDLLAGTRVVVSPPAMLARDLAAAPATPTSAAKAQAAAKPGLPVKGNVFLSVKDSDKPRAVEIARALEKMGFTIYSTSGTAQTLTAAGVPVRKLAKIQEGRPNPVDLIKNGQIQMVINTPAGMIPRRDENAIRSAAYAHNVCIMTTITGAAAAIGGIRALREKHVGVRPIQLYRGNVTVVG